METSLRQSLIISQGDFSIFVVRPISAVLLAIGVVFVLSPLLRRGLRAFPRAELASKPKP